MQKSACIAEI